jgi:hypothetical protein
LQEIAPIYVAADELYLWVHCQTRHEVGPEQAAEASAAAAATGLAALCSRETVLELSVARV